jgi:hypothetical protein
LPALFAISAAVGVIGAVLTWRLLRTAAQSTRTPPGTTGRPVGNPELPTGNRE